MDKLKEARQAAEIPLIKRALTDAKGNVAKAAQILGCPRTTLDYLITRYKLRKWTARLRFESIPDTGPVV